VRVFLLREFILVGVQRGGFYKIVIVILFYICSLKHWFESDRKFAQEFMYVVDSIMNDEFGSFLIGFYVGAILCIYSS
jgi:hypothetical protein